MPTLPCPGQADLDRLALGFLEDDLLLQLGRHVETCSTCLTYVREHEHADPLLDAFRQCTDAVGRRDPAAARLMACVLQQTISFSCPATEGTAPSSGFPEPLEQLGPYRLERHLGAGGMGVVFAARDTRLQRTVALKLLRPDWAREPDARRRFHAEAQALAALPHDHIVPIYDVGEQTDWLYLAMPLLEGETLPARLDREGTLPWTEVAHIGEQVARALDLAHARGIIHRDVKPSNLWLEQPTGRIKVLDFGLARSLRFSTGSDERNAAGTPAYMAPEQARGEPGPASDLYALGCVLFRAGVGRLPFVSDDPGAVLLAAATEPRPRLRDLAPACPPPLAALIEQLLAREPEARPDSAAAVVAAFQQMQLQQARRRQRRWYLGLAAAGLLLVVTGLLFGPIVQRIVSNQGEIVVESDDPDVEVSVRRGGEEVVVLDAKTKRKFALKADAYELHLRGEDPELTLSASRLTLRRGDVAIVTVRHVPLPTGQLTLFPPFEGEVQALAVSADGRRMLVGTGGAILEGQHSRDAGAGLFVGHPLATADWQRLRGLDAAVRAVALTPDGQTAVAADAAGCLALWKLPTSQAAQILRHGEAGVAALAWSPNGRTFLSGHDDGGLSLWDATGQLQRSFGSRGGPVRTVVFLPDADRALAAGDQGVIRLWDVAQGTLLREYSGHRDRVTALAAHPDGKRFLSGGVDGSARVWTLEGEQRVLGGQPDASEKAWAVAWSRDGRRAAFTQGKAVVVWDLADDRPCYRFEGHDAVVRAIAMLPDNRRVLSAGWDQTVRLWAMPPEKKPSQSR